MVVAITGLGSVWRRRFGKCPNKPTRFARAAYYNTTGVLVNGTIRTRTKVAGHARFNSAGGFDPNYPQRTINRVFECDEPCVWQGQNKILFKSTCWLRLGSRITSWLWRGKARLAVSRSEPVDGSLTMGCSLHSANAVTSRKACCSFPRAAG